MQYLCLIYEAEKLSANKTPEEFGEEIAAYGAFTQALKESGQFIAGDALEPVATATTVRIREGKVLHTDGPFAETKEQLGGYYLLEAENLDDALAWAAKIPAAQKGSIEVRPLMQFPAEPES